MLLIDEDGVNLGVVNSYTAFQKAKDLELDLILLNKSADPPVCKIGDFGKLQYELTKKTTKKKELELKTLKIRPVTQKHDLDIEVNKATKFLKEGHKVKFECRFRPRELAHPQVGRDNLDYLLEQLKELIKVDKGCELLGRSMIVIVAPK